MGHPGVLAMLTDDQAPTCSLAEFLDAWHEDPNLVWRVRTGHLINLLRAAVARIETLEALLQTREVSDLDPAAAANSREGFDHGTEAAAEPEPIRRSAEPRPGLSWFHRRAKKPPQPR